LSTCTAALHPLLGVSAAAQSAAEIVDRFSGRRRVVEGAELRAFVEISAANELDVVQHSQVIAGQHGDGLRRLFMRAQQHLPPSARTGASDDEGTS